MKRPTLEEVKEHFKNAKVVEDCDNESIKIKDLNKIYINKNSNYLYRNKKNNYTYLWNKDYGYANIIEYKKEKNIDVIYEEEEVKPRHYELNVVSRKTGKTLICDFLDIANAMNLSIEQFLALRYMRVKGGINKQINDTEKGIESLKAHRGKLINTKQ